MKRLDPRVILFVVLMLVSIGGPIAPAFATSHGSTSPAPAYIQDDGPTPTPTPIHQPYPPCTHNC